MRALELLCRTTVAAVCAALFPAAVMPPPAIGSQAHDGWMAAERLYDWDSVEPSYDAPRRDSGSRYREGRAEHVADWAIGTFHGQNSGNGIEETITIRADGTADLRTRDQPPRHGSLAGETLTFDTRMSRVQPARGGIFIDGAYYNR